jgi:hypothetical protein
VIYLTRGFGAVEEPGQRVGPAGGPSNTSRRVTRGKNDHIDAHLRAWHLGGPADQRHDRRGPRQSGWTLAGPGFEHGLSALPPFMRYAEMERSSETRGQIFPGYHPFHARGQITHFKFLRYFRFVEI